jgi:hypothetical protein
MNRRLALVSLCFLAVFVVAGLPSAVATAPLNRETYVLEGSALASSFAEMTSGVPVTGSLSATGATVVWTIQVAANAVSMYSVLTCGSADFDLYGRLGAAPTTSTYAWRGYTSGGEEVTYNNPGAGTWYVMVRSYSGTGSYTLTVTITYGSAPSTLENGVPVTGSLSATGATKTYTIVVAANAVSMYSVLTCGSADFDLYGRLGAAPTTSTYAWRGYTSGGEEVTYSSPGAGTWYIMVRSYSGTGSFTLTVTITYGGGGGGAEMIAVFFWASDAGSQTVINEYKSVLTSEGYTKFFEFKDTTSFSTNFATVAAYEDSDDIVFFYLFGHGNNDGSHSYTAFRTGGYSIVYSNTFRTLCDGLDSTKVGMVISSCDSGDWADDMAGGGYLAIASSDEDHYSWAVSTLPGEEVFANYFFYYVSIGYNAVEAYNAADAAMPQSGTYAQYPKLVDQCSYNFFD